MFGVHDYTVRTRTMQIIRPASMVVGEFCRDEFKRTHDIALLKLEREVVYNNFIQGICLPPESETSVPSESACFVAGWGLLGKLLSITI